MTVGIHFLNAAGRLRAEAETEIRLGIEDAAALLSAHLPVEKIDVTVQPWEGAVYGRAYGPESCTLYVNPADSVLKKWPRQRLSQLCVHELHHVLRWRSMAIRSFDDWTTGEVLALEGLASHCELFLGFPSYPALEIDDALLQPLLDRIAPDIAAPYAEVSWFDGACDLPVENLRAANAMGHLVAKRFLERSGATPISAVHAPWQEVCRIGLAADPA